MNYHCDPLLYITGRHGAPDAADPKERQAREQPGARQVQPRHRRLDARAVGHDVQAAVVRDIALPRKPPTSEPGHVTFNECVRAAVASPRSSAERSAALMLGKGGVSHDVRAAAACHAAAQASHVASQTPSTGHNPDVAEPARSGHLRTPNRLCTGSRGPS